jgi:hypothetical protein
MVISYSGPILRTVRQRTFVRQHLAEVEVLNPSAAQLTPIAVVRHRSRASLRRPHFVSLRDGSNIRSTRRFNARITPRAQTRLARHD